MRKFIEFWNRDVGALWLPFEHERIKDFSQVKPDQHVSLSGYAKQINNRTFALVPTPFSNQTHLICRNFTERLPNENSPVRIEGHARRTRLSQAKPASVFFEGDLLIDVMDWREEKPIIRHTDLYEYFGLSKDYSLKDFRREALRVQMDYDEVIIELINIAETHLRRMSEGHNA